MGCRNCPKTVEELPKKESLWLTQDEVKKICYICYKGMVANNITKIKKEHFFKILKEVQMTFYEITYTGEATCFNFLGISLKKYKPVYMTKDELPMSVAKLRKFPDVKVTTLKNVNRPTPVEASIKGAKMQGLKGVMWVGASPRRVNDYGTFVKGKPRFDLSPEAFAYLKETSGFKVV